MSTTESTQQRINSRHFLNFTEFIFVRLEKIKELSVEHHTQFGKGTGYLIAHVLNAAIVEAEEKYPVPSTYRFDVVRNFEAMMREILNDRRCYLMGYFKEIWNGIEDFLEVHRAELVDFEIRCLEQIMHIVTAYECLKNLPYEGIAIVHACEGTTEEKV